MKQALLYKHKKDDHVQCNACAWHCNIAPGKTGICGVRKNIDGELYSFVYGKPSAVQIDPIEKKPFYHFLPIHPVFSIGTIGCNFDCQFCQNWHLSQKNKQSIKNKNKSLESLVEKYEEWSPKRIVKYCKEKAIPIIAYTYNEPAIFFRYTYDTAKLAYKNGINNVYVSNGFESEEALDMISPYIDAINIDLKSFSSDFYKNICKGKLSPVKRNIKNIVKKYKNIWLEITTLLIPGKNDSKKELKEIAKFISNLDKNIPWHISKFHPDYQMKDESTTSPDIMERAYEIGKEAGLNFVYIGNMSHETAVNTYCPNCGKEVINRVGFDINIKLKNNNCPNCGFIIPGVWQNFS